MGSRVYQSFIVCVLVAALLGFVVVSGVADGMGRVFNLNGVGANDFLQYWSASRLLNGGQNPYDALQMHEFQVQMGLPGNETVLMWNPPWTVALMAPILVLPFSAAVGAWFLLSLVLVCIMAVLIPASVARRSPRPVLCAAATALFYPMTESLRLGQLSIALTFALTVFLWCVRRRSFIFAGLALVPLSVKPHLFFLMVVPGVLWLRQLSRGDRTRFLGGVVSGGVVVVVGTVLVWPESVQWWLQALSHPPTAPGAVPMEEWQTATVSSWIRRVLLEWTGALHHWPMWFVPLLALTATGGFFLLKRPTICWAHITPPVLCLSLLCGSYGWLFDQTLLLVLHLKVFSQVLEWKQQRVRRRGLALLLLVNVMVWGVAALPQSAQHYFAWVPLAFLLLWWWSERVTSGFSEQLTQPASR